jgi:hypothetical protein
MAGRLGKGRRDIRMIAQLAVLFLLILFPVLVTGPAKWFGG